MRLQLTRRLACALAIVICACFSAFPAFASDAGEAPQAPPASTAPQAPPKTRDIDVRVSSELATYVDSDNVYVVSPSIGAVVSKPTAGWSVNGSYLVDVVSAASVDILSTASRRWEEVRNAGSLNGSYQIGNWGLGATTNISIEPDYQSYVGGASATYDLLQKNVTLLVSYYHGHDIAGRSGTPFSVFSHVIDTNGFKVGGTTILDRATFLSVVSDLIFENGDTSKPYRYVPMFAPGTFVPIGASIADVTALRLSERVLEQLPIGRNRYALSARIGHRFEHMTLRLDERIYTDSWGLHATTTDARLIFDPAERLEIGPHLRFHGQTAVDFWQRAYTINPGFDYPAVRTGDRELGPLVTATAGGTIHLLMGKRPNPRSLIFGLDLNIASTQYLDDIYISQRTSGVAALMMEMDL